MTWQPGQSGNPNGFSGPRRTNRHKQHQELLDRMRSLGHADALMTLSEIQNDKSNDAALRIAAAASLAPFCHPKVQGVPAPRIVDLDAIEVPATFDRVSDAENFLAKLALAAAAGRVDLQDAMDVSGLIRSWIDSQNNRMEVDYKVNPPAVRDQTISIRGILPQLPGTNIEPPVVDGHPSWSTNGHALEAPAPVIEAPADSSAPSSPADKA
jgi:hypothetical protein